MRGDGACPVCLNRRRKRGESRRDRACTGSVAGEVQVRFRRRLGDVHPARTRYVLIEIDDVSPNRLASIEEIEIH